MVRFTIAAACLLLIASSAFAQDAWQFRWQKGQTLTYKIKHVTSVVEVVDNAKNTSHSDLDIVNRWQVGAVDADGVATVTLTLTAMRHEQKRANGETLLFDSQNLEKSTPELREQMSKYIGKTLAIVRVDELGRVRDVKQGSAASFEAELPFVVVLPGGKAEAGHTWRRAYNLTLEPPLGAGEKYAAEQRYECKKLEAGKATLTLATEVKMLPESARDRLPLLQKDVQGEVVIDVRAGRLLSAKLHIDKTVEGHQGQGSSYQFKSEYSRQLEE